MNLKELQAKWDEEIPDASDFVPDDERFESWEPEYEIDWRDFL